jgi:hypothetical protein
MARVTLGGTAILMIQCLFRFASGGGSSPISHADESTPGGSLSARDAKNTLQRLVQQINPDSKLTDR